MPAIRLKLSGTQAEYNLQEISAALMNLTCKVLEKEPQRTMLLLEFIPRELWYINLKNLSALEQNAFKVEVTITDETCTKQQKALYIFEVFQLMTRYISNLHQHCNVHVIDCRGSAYGYGGVTQENYAQHRP
ncbi:4-oxalocrotonate tautomerase [Acinetobacter calcoaceticus]|uniref:4-oxalocrotonate tautomerase n=1 Tax=Acinetobacter calcoaceticus TaxID=471 RepID=A0A4R1XWV0_ACICA|nr:4-oxalocrotonate tautomerase [Acinetobacter calcoaceticus]